MAEWMERARSDETETITPVDTGKTDDLPVKPRGLGDANDEEGIDQSLDVKWAAPAKERGVRGRLVERWKRGWRRSPCGDGAGRNPVASICEREDPTKDKDGLCNAEGVGDVATETTTDRWDFWTRPRLQRFHPSIRTARVWFRPDGVRWDAVAVLSRLYYGTTSISFGRDDSK